MKLRSIKLHLVTGIVALAVIPLLASFLLLDEIIEGVINASMTSEVKSLLNQYQSDLKQLKILQPEKEHQYRESFYNVNEIYTVIENEALFKNVIKETFRSYYFILSTLVVIFAVVISYLLNRKVSRSYEKLLQDDIRKAERILELKQFDLWQQVARKLAHEINNPLTPIEIMVGNLEKSYQSMSGLQFQQNLKSTNQVVVEEVNRLKKMVGHFNQYSKLPSPSLCKLDLYLYCKEFVDKHGSGWPKIDFSVEKRSENQEYFVEADPFLFTQCLLNLVKNAQEANQERKKVKVQFILSLDGSNVVLAIKNDGKPIPASERQYIFRMYYTSNKQQNNMGLGLNIIEKIISEHHGQIRCLAVEKGAEFRIVLPQSYKYD